MLKKIITILLKNVSTYARTEKSEHVILSKTVKLLSMKKCIFLNNATVNPIVQEHIDSVLKLQLNCIDCHTSSTMGIFKSISKGFVPYLF